MGSFAIVGASPRADNAAMDMRRPGLAPIPDPAPLTRRAWLRGMLEPRRVVAGTLALLPLAALGAGTALGAGSSNPPSAATGAVNHATDSHSPADSSGHSGKTDSSKGSDKGHAGSGSQGASGPNGTTLSVVSNNKTNHVWVVSTDNKSGGMSVIGSAVVTHNGSGSNGPPNGSSKDSHTAAPSDKGATGGGDGGSNKPGAVPYSAHYDNGSHSVTVVETATNKVVANMPDRDAGQSFGAPNTPPSHPQMPPATDLAKPNGSSTHLPQ